MSYMLQHLHNGYQVDQAILSEEDRIVVRKSLKYKIQSTFGYSLINFDFYFRFFQHFSD